MTNSYVFYTDEISNLKPENGAADIAFSESGIAWPSDAAKFKKSPLASNSNVRTLVYPPPQWVKASPIPGRDYSNGYTPENFPDITSMERFQVWMRPAGLPNFRKLWGRRDQNVPAGKYTITITDSMYSA
jgi:hypothetical protein